MVKRSHPAVPTEHADGGDVRVGPVMGVPAVLESLGGDTRGLLVEFGLKSDFFDDPERTVPSRTVGRILGRCVARTRCEHFGLLVGERAGISSLGAVGYLMQSAPTVGQALQLLATKMHAHDRGGIATVQRGDGYASLGYALVSAEVEHADQLTAIALAIAMNILRGLCGGHWRPVEVNLSFTAPKDTRPYRKFFGLTPRFDAEHSNLVFSDDVLAQSLPSADPLLHLLMQARVEQQLASGVHDLVAQLRRFLRAEVMSAHCSLEAASRYLGMHSRALRRRLHDEGTGFRRLVNEARFDAARQLLRNTHTPIQEIATALGYADTSAFTRAFARYAGIAPRQWRSRETQRSRRQPAAAASPAARDPRRSSSSRRGPRPPGRG